MALHVELMALKLASYRHLRLGLSLFPGVIALPFLTWFLASFYVRLSTHAIHLTQKGNEAYRLVANDLDRSRI